MGYVYLIYEPSTGNYKIGVTTGSIERRMKKLQTGNSSELHVAKYFQCEHPFKLEAMLHAFFKPKLVINEWYDLSLQEVDDFTATCEKLDHTISNLRNNPFFFKKK